MQYKKHMVKILTIFFSVLVLILSFSVQVFALEQSSVIYDDPFLAYKTYPAEASYFTMEYTNGDTVGFYRYSSKDAYAALGDADNNHYKRLAFRASSTPSVSGSVNAGYFYFELPSISLSTGDIFQVRQIFRVMTSVDGENWTYGSFQGGYVRYGCTTRYHDGTMVRSNFGMFQNYSDQSYVNPAPANDESAFHRFITSLDSFCLTEGTYTVERNNSDVVGLWVYVPFGPLFYDITRTPQYVAIDFLTPTDKLLSDPFVNYYGSGVNAPPTYKDLRGSDKIFEDLENKDPYAYLNGLSAFIYDPMTVIQRYNRPWQAVVRWLERLFEIQFFSDLLSFSIAIGSAAIILGGIGAVSQAVSRVSFRPKSTSSKVSGEVVLRERSDGSIRTLNLNTGKFGNRKG